MLLPRLSLSLLHADTLDVFDACFSLRLHAAADMFAFSAALTLPPRYALPPLSLIAFTALTPLSPSLRCLLMLLFIATASCSFNNTAQNNSHMNTNRYHIMKIYSMITGFFRHLSHAA